MSDDRSNDADFVLWAKQVKQRDDFTCQICGKNNIYLESHHVYNWHDFPEQRYLINNGVTLCKYHHEQFHVIYGKRFNSREQFEQYKSTYKLFKNSILKG